MTYSLLLASFVSTSPNHAGAFCVASFSNSLTAITFTCTAPWCRLSTISTPLRIFAQGSLQISQRNTMSATAHHLRPQRREILTRFLWIVFDNLNLWSLLSRCASAR